MNQTPYAPAATSTPVYDVVIIGGGIVGLATGMALRDKGVGVLVLEAETRLAAHQSSHNSGVIHSGLYYKPGSLKALNCVAGRDLMYRFCEEEGLPVERSGKLVVATHEREIPSLDELERRGRANGLTGMRRIGLAELKEVEPEVNGITGLWVPEAGMADFGAVALAFAKKIVEAGGRSAPGSGFPASSQKQTGFSSPGPGGKSTQKLSSIAPDCTRTVSQECAASIRECRSFLSGASITRWFRIGATL